MPKILLTQNRNLDVQREDADRIESEWLSGEKMIRITDELTVRRGEIKGVDRGKSGQKKKYDLSDSTDKGAILEFEKLIEGLKGTTMSANTSEFYGHPLEKYEGLVVNELLGAVHWTVVHYALKENIIRRKDGPTTYWSVVAEVSGKNLDTSKYVEFRGKLDALHELNGRRSYAQSKDLEEKSQIVEQQIHALAEGTSLPNNSVDDDLPF